MIDRVVDFSVRNKLAVFAAVAVAALAGVWSIQRMPLDASDEQQLLQAAARERCVLTFNIGDFMRLAQTHPAHAGIVLAQQKDWTLSALISALDKLLTQTSAEEWGGKVAWLNQWR